MQAHNRKLYAPLLFFVAITTVTAIVTITSMYWYVPTRMQLDLLVDRFVFTFDKPNSTAILNRVPFESISIEKISQVEMSPETMELADPAQYDLKEDRYPEASWVPLSLKESVSIIEKQHLPSSVITFDTDIVGQSFTAMINQLYAVQGAEVTLDLRADAVNHLTLSIYRQKSLAELSFLAPFYVTTEYSQLRGIEHIPFEADSLTYRVHLSEQNRFVNIESQANAFVMVMTIPTEKLTDSFTDGNLLISEIDFSRLDYQGQRRSSLIGNGEIRYPDYPHIDNRSFDGFVLLDQLQKFNIKQISLSQVPKGIHLQLDGIVGKAYTGSAEFPENQLLSVFDRIWEHSKLIALFVIIGFVIQTVIKTYRLYKELHQ